MTNNDAARIRSEKICTIVQDSFMRDMIKPNFTFVLYNAVKNPDVLHYVYAKKVVIPPECKVESTVDYNAVLKIAKQIHDVYIHESDTHVIPPHEFIQTTKYQQNIRIEKCMFDYIPNIEIQIRIIYAQDVSKHDELGQPIVDYNNIEHFTIAILKIN